MNGKVENRKTEGNRPVDTLRDGVLKLAIFQNEREHGIAYAVRPSRIYKDESGNVRETSSLAGSELIRMSRLLEKGYDRIAEFRQQSQTKVTRRERER